ncbi:MAG: glycosyltransferase, partial [Rhodobacteraceae bacterium]|nr:glycosyltransferase [Paracoccaceae bacterium]
MSAPRPGPVAYLTGEYPRATDTFIQREVAGLRALGIVVHTCTVRRTGPEHLAGPEQRAEAAATFHVIEAARNPARLLAAHAGALLRAPGRWLRAVALAWRTRAPGLRGTALQAAYFAEAGVLAAHLRATGARHLHNHIATGAGTVAMLAAEITGLPFSITLHGPGIFHEPMRWRLDEKAARAAFVACISHFARAQLMLFADRRHWPRFHIVHCGVEPGRYDRPRRAAPGQRLLFVGRLAGVKGVPVLLAALAGLRRRHPSVHLTLIGDGPERAALEAEAAALGLGGAVRFAGYASQEGVAAALAEADILVLPSFAEGVPVVLMEALAAGVAVVATAVGGVGELITPECGLLVAPGDAEALEHALDALLADPGARAALAAAGRA